MRGHMRGGFFNRDPRLPRAHPRSGGADRVRQVEQSVHEWQRAAEEKEGEVHRMRHELDAARESASSNAALASEAANRLRQAEGAVEDIRRQAAAAEERAQHLEADASRAKGDAAKAARDRENSLREQLAAAEQRYERLAAEAEQASANAVRGGGSVPFLVHMLFHRTRLCTLTSIVFHLVLVVTTSVRHHQCMTA